MQRPKDGIIEREIGKAGSSALSEAARRALAEAEERRRRANQHGRGPQGK